MGRLQIPYVVRQAYESPAIQPTERAPVVIEVEWETSEETPPMLALVHTPGIIVSLGNGEKIASPPATFLIRTNQDVPLGIKLTPKLVEAVGKLSGWKSPEVEAAIAATQDSSI